MAANPFSHKNIEKYILSMPNVKLEYPFGETTAVYKIGDKMFALVQENKNPINLSLKCDPNLSQLLQSKYESVMPGYHLNKKNWITIILGGQLSSDEIKDLITLSYNLVTKTAEN